VLLLAFTAGCTSSPSAPTVTPEFSQTEIVIGLGDPPAANGDLLNVVYTGWLYDPTKADLKGVQFDASPPGLAPFSFRLGNGQVIQGWEQGLVGIRVGGSRRLVIPPSLSYGGIRHTLIPPNQTLVFEIQLQSIG
jgi:FKBP-type peptidyl-prolyl cis-trans isomerase FkpA